jgi:hypothetical protein
MVTLSAAAVRQAPVPPQAPAQPTQAQPQTPVHQPPDFRVQIYGDALIDFSLRVRSYADLRRQLEQDLPPLRVTESAKDLLSREHALARKLRAARADAREGDVFTSAVGAAVRDALQRQTSAATCAALLDDNPGAIDLKINGRYPEHKPLSTMPPNVLAALPPLPDGIEYRFAGGHLILFDTRARMLIDRLTSAVECPAPRLP